MEHKTKMAKQRIVVMYGGKADEHSISCISAAGVLRALDTDKFEAIEVGITKNGEWIVGGEDPRKWNMSEGLPMVEKKHSLLGAPLSSHGNFSQAVSAKAPDIVHAAEIDLLALKAAGVIPASAKAAKVIKAGALDKAVKLTGIGVTKGAKAVIEAAGGSVA